MAPPAPLSPRSRRQRRSQPAPSSAAAAAPQPVSAPAAPAGFRLTSLAADTLLLVADFLPFTQRLRLLQLSRAFRAALLEDGRLLEEIAIPDWCTRLQPSDIARLFRLVAPGRVRALRIG